MSAPLSRRETLFGALAGFLRPLLPKKFPVPRFIKAPRFEIPFYTVSMAKFEKTWPELKPYDLPVTSILEEEDRRILLEVEKEAIRIGRSDITFKEWP